MQTLIAGDSQLHFQPEAQTVVLEGTMRLANMREYDVVAQYLDACRAVCPDNLTMDLRKLLFLNSSGITTLSLFVIQCKRQGQPALQILGSKNTAWQEKSLPNFSKLWTAATVVFE